MQTIYEYNNSNGAATRLDRDAADALIRLYPVAYYGLVNARDLAIGADIIGGREVACVSLKLDDGTTRGSWLEAQCGTRATALRIAAEWRALFRVVA